MANCILCGQKVGLLDRKNFMFHGSVQTLCIGCTARLDSAAPQEREELFRQMLDSPDLEDGERIRADLNTGRHCPACGGMLERRLRNFSIGADGYGGLTSLGLEQFEVDLYVCAKCRRVELYAAEHEVPLRTEQNDQVTCPVCGTKHSALCGCPTCAVQAAYVPRAARPEQKQSPEPVHAPEQEKHTFPWQNDQVTCPVCGTKHSALCGCPTCAVQAAYVPRAARPEQKQSPEPVHAPEQEKHTFPWQKKKVPWEK